MFIGTYSGPSAGEDANGDAATYASLDYGFASLVDDSGVLWLFMALGGPDELEQLGKFGFTFGLP